MKKFTLVVMALLALSFSVKAQQYVSTEPSNRNVVLEEFTGRLCGYCPEGHIIANQIKANHPDSFWSINIHSAGSNNFSTDTYPNLNTTKGNAIRAAFNCSSFPGGVVNRATASSVGRGQWSGQANTQFNQSAECNVAGVAKINPETRMAAITVEVYYTGNSTSSQNYLTIMMLQDSILGSQSSGSTNPAQMINGQYCHMHVLRDIVTATMGDEISPATQGSLITKTYEYQIPESIGNPNGVEVKLEHISFVAFVSEKYQGTPTRPILNACELEKSFGTDEPIYPYVSAMQQDIVANCEYEQRFEFIVLNIGTEPLTSLKYNVQIGEVTSEMEWKGELASGEDTMETFSMDIPVGTYTGTLNITEANGTPFIRSKAFEAESSEVAEVNVDTETTLIKIFIIQDQWGEQITWKLINSADEVVAQGGPYQNLAGSGSTQANIEIVDDLPADECYLFRIYDSGDNGICCNYGNGRYYIKDANGNKFIEADGDYGSEGHNLFSITKTMTAVESVAQESLKVYPNPANSKIYVDGKGIEFVEVYNSLGQLVLSLEGTDNTSFDVASFANGIYVVRAFDNNGMVTTKKVTIAH